MVITLSDDIPIDTNARIYRLQTEGLCIGIKVDASHFSDIIYASMRPPILGYLDFISITHVRLYTQMNNYIVSITGSSEEFNDCTNRIHRNL